MLNAFSLARGLVFHPAPRYSPFSLGMGIRTGAQEPVLTPLNGHVGSFWSILSLNGTKSDVRPRRGSMLGPFGADCCPRLLKRAEGHRVQANLEGNPGNR
jgi:hypothetical protein